MNVTRRSGRVSLLNTRCMGLRVQAAAAVVGMLLSVAATCGDSGSPAAPNQAAAKKPASAGAVEVKPEADLSALLAEVIRKHEMPGVVAAIVERDRITAIGAAGIRCRGHVEAMTTDDLLHLGSNAKSMTATVIAMLVEEGKLRWDTSPAEIFLKKDPAAIDSAWKHVTLDQLLTHRAGLPANPPAEVKLSVRRLRGSPVKQRQEVCEAALRKPPDNQPGTTYLYSNVGFIMAGAIAETVAGVPWEELMQQRLFKPLGMTTVGYGAPGSSDPAMPEAARAVLQPCGHTEGGKAVLPGPGADNPAYYGPAGTVHLSIGDWAKYASLHMAGSKKTVGPAPLLSRAAIARLHVPLGGPIDRGGTKYAKGWSVRERKSGGPVLQHFGSNTYWKAAIVVRPQQNVAFLVVTNQGGAASSQAVNEVLRALADRVDKRETAR